MYENLHMFEKANISPISAPLCYVYECNLFYRFGAHKLEIASSPFVQHFPIFVTVTYGLFSVTAAG